MSTQTVDSEKSLHFVMIPLMSQGHQIPMIDIARLLAQRGRHVTVTVITTPLNAARFAPILDRAAAAAALDIRILRLRFPHAEAGLPEGCESADALPNLSYAKNFYRALELLQPELEDLFPGLKPSPSCIISDKNIVWAAETARKFGVPRILFDGLSCFALSCIHSLRDSKIHERVGSDSEPFVVPGLPDRIELTRAKLSGAFNPGSDHSLKSTRERVMDAEEGAYGFIVNTFEGLEFEYVKRYRGIKGQRVWCVGPVSLCNKDELDKAQRGKCVNIVDNWYQSKASNNEAEYLPGLKPWLDSRAPGSVLYACFGSMSSLPPAQQAELGLALEAAERPFVWVIRGGYKSEELENWLRQDGFEGRVCEGKRLGFLVRGWAPQVQILSHPAVGAFLTHCGWNSTLEGVCAGLPMVTWPMFAEQFYNERFVGQVLGIGVSVGAERVVHRGEEDKFGVLVKRDQIREAIEKVMDEGKEGLERREKAKKLAKAAKEAVEEGGSSYHNITLLLQDIMQQN